MRRAPSVATPRVPNQAKFTWLIPFLGALTALGPLSNDLYVPSLPLVADGLHAGGGAVQLTLSTLLLGLSLGSLIYGPLSDQYGRKPILCIGLAVYVLAGILSALATDLAHLVVWRFLQGLGASAAMVLARAIILDRWRGSQASRALSWVAMVTFLSPVLAPVLGGYVASLGYWPTVFWLHAMAGALCLLVSLTMLPRAERHPESRLLQRIAAYGSILEDRQALGYMACTGLGFIGVAAFISNSSFVFIEYFELEPYQYGYCFSLIMLGGVFGAFINSRLVAQLGISKLIGIGTLFMAIGGLSALITTALGGGLFGILIPALFYMFGVGFVFANSMARTLSRFPASMGAASAVFGVNQFLIGALVAAALSLIPEPAPLPLVAAMAAAGLAAAALWWSWLRHLVPDAD
ncbi:MAG TPA: multidrug effflux MFS transporter [Gammaproteobacteria bacterium]|nr:multidrug effflux MFS transporter [Gammaproteobacteria bacterium]